MKKYFIIHGVLLTTLIVGIYSLNMRPIYAGDVKLLIERATPKVMAVDQVVNMDTGNRDFLQTQFDLLKSRSLAKSVIQKLHLENDEMFGDKLGISTIFRPIIRWIKTLAHFGGKNPDLEVERDPYSNLVDIFLTKLKISPAHNSRLVTVRFTGHSPKTVAEVANTLAELYIAKNIELRSSIEQEAGVWLQKQIPDVQRKIDISEKELQEFKENNNLIELNNKMGIASQKLSDLNAEVLKARTDAVRLTALKNQLDKLKDDPKELLQSIPESLKSETILNLTEEYLALQTEYDENSKKFSPRHPSMKDISQKLRIVENRFPKEIERLFKSVEIDHKAAQARGNTMTAALENQKRVVMQLEKDTAHYRTLNNKVKNTQKLFNSLLKRMGETDLSSKYTESNIRIVDPAEIPLSPFKPNITYNLLKAVAFGLLLSLILVFFMESLNASIKTFEDIEKNFPVSVLATVGLFDKPIGSLPMIHQENSPRAEEIRILRTNFFHAFPDNPKKVILISSSTPMEGKTTIVSNLAVSISHLGRRVLLVDADLKKANIHSIFNVKPKPGIVEAVFDQSPLDACVHKTRINNLWVLPAGGRSKNSSEILSSEKFAGLLARLRQNFDHILLDGPPILHLADSSVLTKLCDGVLFVVKAGVTHIDLIRRAFALINMAPVEMEYKFPGKSVDDKIIPISPAPPVNTKIIGAVLNMADPRYGEYGYGYYGKYYGRYMDHDLEASTAKPSKPLSA